MNFRYMRWFQGSTGININLTEFYSIDIYTLVLFVLVLSNYVSTTLIKKFVSENLTGNLIIVYLNTAFLELIKLLSTDEKYN